MANPFGPITKPSFLKYADLEQGGLVLFLNNLLRLLVAAGGLLAFLNLIIAGYGFMTAGGDPKGVANAWNKIWQSLLGLLIIVSSFVLAAIFGHLLFGDATAILQPKIYGPE